MNTSAESSKKLNASLFARKTNWKNSDYQYLKNVTITEWDIKSAGLSVIKFKKLLPQNEISKLETMDKKARTIREGLFQKENPVLAEAIVKTLEDVRQGFVYVNGITEPDVLSIKKDAIFLINVTPNITNIKDYFIFRQKKVYSSYILLNKVEFYLEKNGELDIKGLGSEIVEKQRLYILKDIKYILTMAEKVSQQQLLTILKNYRKRYLNMTLDLETYRELDTGLFRLKNGFFVDVVDSSILSQLDITQNYMKYILPLFNMLL